MFRVIDADTHVLETEDTWDFLLPSEESLRPQTESPRNPDLKAKVAYWNFAGHRRPRFITDDTLSGTTRATRELLDVDARVRHMDELGIETHVIYPSVFLTEPAEEPETELAWVRSYNRWLADRCARSKGRLRWICIPPLRNMKVALEELRFAKDHGACGILKKGDQEAGKWPADEYFFELYEEAERLDMPICFHLGSGIPEFPSSKVFELARFMRLRLPVIHGIHSLITQKIPDRFPKLRFGAIEAGAGWVPWIQWDLERRAEIIGFDATKNAFRSNRIYVTAQVDEDLPYIIKAIGDDNLIAGSDYSHTDPSTEVNHVTRLQARADRGDISQESVRKILFDNAKAFYGL